MVHQSSLVISKDTRHDLEDGGGTKSKTRALRASWVLNFVTYYRGAREDAWCADPPSSPMFLKEGAPDHDQALPQDQQLGHYFKNWFWEMQVFSHVLG